MNPYQRETNWHGLYGSSRDDILRDPASVSHPAKMSLRLLSRIIAQMQEWGWLRPGSCLVDPFAGTFSTGITWAALHPDNRACGIELEGHFVAMGRQNQAHAEKRLGRPLALTILRGDSRHVAALLAGDLSTTRALVAKERAALEAAWRADWSAVAFQPFAGYAVAVGKAWVLEEWGDRGAVTPMVCAGSPPYAGEGKRDQIAESREVEVLAASDRKNPHGLGSFRGHYGRSEGQISNLPDREAVALASPPYGQGVIGQADPKQAARLRALTQDPTSSLHGRSPEGAWFRAMERGYGASEGNIDACPDAAACGSPPYADTLTPRNGIDVSKCEKAGKTSQAYHRGYAAAGSPPFEAQNGGHAPASSGPLADPSVFSRHAASRVGEAAGYGENAEAQIGVSQGETYSQACYQVYKGLADAGVRYLALVVKCPTRDGKLRRLDQLTARLLRAAGYRVRAWRRAWLFEEQAQAEARHGQGSLFGEEVEPSKKVVGRLSFFRRLHLAKGGVAAKWEDVYFAELVGRGEFAAVASPPYGEAHGANLGKMGDRGYEGEARKYDQNSRSLARRQWLATDTPGQIGNLRDVATP